jgi:putative resolvase
MKLSVYAQQRGISYRTTFRWFKRGQIQGQQMDTGTILITEPAAESQAQMHPMKVAIYTRVSAAENKDNLDGQAVRLQDDCAAKGYPGAPVVKEIGSGVNDTRPKLLKLLTDATITLIAACAPRSGVVEHTDRLTRLGCHYSEPLLNLQDRRSEVVNLADAERGQEDLVQDFVSSVTSFCAQLDGPRRSKRQTERMIAALQAEAPHGEESPHSSQTRPGQSRQTATAR